MDNSNLKELIELFNSGYWEKNVKQYFKRVRTFLKYVAVKGLSEKISVETLDNEDYNEGPDFFEFLNENGYLKGREYDDFDDELRNYFLSYWISVDPNNAFKYITDYIITDVEIRDDGFWLYLMDRDELAPLFDGGGRNGTARNVAEHVFGEDMWEPYWDTTSDVYSDVIEELDESNYGHLENYILKMIGNQDLVVDDYSSDFFHDLAKSQNRGEFFMITQNDVNELLKDSEAMNELLDGDLSDLKSELYSIHNNAYNGAFQDECYELVYGGLEEFFSSKIEDVQIKSGDKTKWASYIKIKDFKRDVMEFIELEGGSTYNESSLAYWGGYVSMLGHLMDNHKVYDKIDFRVPDYPDWTYLRKQINDLFQDYI